MGALGTLPAALSTTRESSMANHYLKLAFILNPTPEEISLLDECYALSLELDELDESEHSPRYEQMSEAFKSTFPSTLDQSTNAFHAFLDLFGDRDFPTFDCDHFGVTDGNGYLISGTQADPHAIASLIQKCAPSVLPFGFEWSQDCDRLRPGDLGGGYYIVTNDNIIGGSTHWLMQAQLKDLETPLDKSVASRPEADPDSTSFNEALEIETCLVLTTGHLSPQTADILNAWVSAERSDCPITVGGTPYGWFVPARQLHRAEFTPLPEDLVAVLRFASAKGCDHVLFDRDGPTLDGLQHHEW